MKKLFGIGICIAVFLAVLVTGCAATTSKITEYNAEGKVVKVTETSESVVSSVMASTKDKMVFVNDQSVGCGLEVVPAASDAENPMGAFKVLFARADRQLLTVPPAMPAATVSALASMINAGRAGEISVGTTGISTTNEAAKAAE